jgi:NADPH-dependent 2,4-dienoyl-CoA reductase/sulfur reductase-like enzyme
MLILGVGVGPATEFLANSGFELEKDKGIKVDEFLRVPGYDGKIFAVSEDGAGLARYSTPERFRLC